MKAQAFRNTFLVKDPTNPQLALLADNLTALERVTQAFVNTRRWLGFRYFFHILFGYPQSYRAQLVAAQEMARHHITENVASLSKVITKKLPSDVVQRAAMNAVSNAYEMVEEAGERTGKLFSYCTWEDFLKSLPEKVPGVTIESSPSSKNVNRITYRTPAQVVRPSVSTSSSKLSISAAMKPGLGIIRR